VILIFTYEEINYPQDVNAKISAANIKNVEYHYHYDLEVVLVLKGEINLTIRGENHCLKENDLFLINGFSQHRIYSKEDNVVLLIHIDSRAYKGRINNFNHNYFKCSTIFCETEKKEVFAGIFKMITSVYEEYVNRGKYYERVIDSTICILIVLLIRHFSCNNILTKYFPVINDLSKEDFDRLVKIYEHIQINYKSKLTLQEVAQKEHLDFYYMSKLIKKMTGNDFSGYLRNIRVLASMRELVDTTKSIDSIAIDNGFCSASAMNKAYKLQQLAYTPSEYRKLNKGSTVINESAKIQEEIIPFNSDEIIIRMRSFNNFIL